MASACCGKRSIIYFKAIYKLWKSSLSTMTEIGNKGYDLNKFNTNNVKISYLDIILCFGNYLLLLVSLFYP